MVNNKTIPKPENPPSSEPTPLTAQEMADLPSPKRSIVQYEEQIRILKEEKKYFQEQNQILISHMSEKENLVKELSQVQTEQKECLYYSTLNTALIALGGAFLGIANSNWALVGWTLLLSGIALSFLNRNLLQSLIHKTLDK